MNIERPAGLGKSTVPLTRADVELLLSKVDDPAQLNLSFQHLEHCNLSYLDLRGANLRGASLHAANLRGTNLGGAHLQAANLSEADLDGADLTGAFLGEDAEERVDLRQANLSYAILRNLDLREFDLTDLDLHNADLNGSDLRDAVLHNTNLQGADLSTAQLYGPELRKAILHGGALFSDKMHPGHRLKAHAQPVATEQLSPEPAHIPASPRPELSDQDAMRLGEQALLAESDASNVRQLFPYGFTFARARILFDAWLAQSNSSYSEQEIQALWIGFAIGYAQAISKLSQ
ncbi:pentapeptide repeat-containing protein [Dictyobacter kobayashii]|uniref:Pentapeptide repeat-containing protein n=1 Tax=Dictyobacter kobayashii TaxID=2014872 RepID=A0A402AYC4_9CHLR|nr:pentapeptide repeat-containing protein [Dictyobacter kobayashii]GCE24112.1 hypothetical protein KDK_79120 [Dictyobacter kobayashii]